MADVVIAHRSLVILLGPSGAGKSTWTAEHMGPSHVVSSDHLRELVGVDEHDQRAGTDAFDTLDLIVERATDVYGLGAVLYLALRPVRAA